MSIKQHLTNDQARQFGDKFGSEWDRGCASVEQLIRESGIDLDRFKVVTRGRKRKEGESLQRSKHVRSS